LQFTGSEEAGRGLIDPDSAADRAPASARVSHPALGPVSCRAALAAHRPRRPDAAADLDAQAESPAAAVAEEAGVDAAVDSGAPPAAAAVAAVDAAAAADASSSPAGHTKDGSHSSGPNSRRD